DSFSDLNAFSKEKKLNLVQFINFGKSNRNIAITAIDARKSSRSDLDFQIFVTVQNFGLKKEDFTLKIFMDGDMINAKDLSLGPFQRESILFHQNIINPGDHIIKVVADVEDYLEADNVAYAVLSQNRNISILLITKGNIFLEKALSVQNFQLSKVSPSDYLNLTPFFLNYDILIFDDFSPSPDTLKNFKGGLFFIHSVVEGYSPIRLIGKVEKPIILDWEDTNPTMRFVDLSDVKIAKALKVETLEWGKTLVESDQTPLLVIGKKENRIMFLGFELHDSDLPLKISFPILIYNAKVIFDLEIL
ncbi:MAG: hypothetical protein ACE5J3_04575, partial [Methanosarcinales archaeon]